MVMAPPQFFDHLPQWPFDLEESNGIQHGGTGVDFKARHNPVTALHGLGKIRDTSRITLNYWKI